MLTTWIVLAAIVGCSTFGTAQAAESGKTEHRPHVVFVTGDDEYRSEITMPMLARILESQHGMRTTVLYARPTPKSKDNIEGLDALKTADLAVFYLRFRALPEEQLKQILAYVDAGKPIVGLRTSTHAFAYPKGHAQAALNDSFGRDVFGQKWLYHHGHTSTTDVEVVSAQRDHPILRGVEPKFHVASWLYHVLPLTGDVTPLLIGRAVHSEQKEQVPNPVAWTKSHHGGKVFFTTLGHPADFEVESVRRLLVNSIYWGLGRNVPAKAEVPIPTGYTTPATH